MANSLVDPEDADAGGPEDRFSADIDPQSALPPQLQGKSYARDILDRMRANPVRNPDLAANRLADDGGSREIVRQFLYAGLEREHAVLMYNQARVFRHLLGRVMEGLGTFLNQPVVTVLRSPVKPRALSGNGPREETPQPDAPGGWGTVGRSLLAWALTPKYIALVVLGFLGLATGWSQLELYHLKRTITAYEQATAASDEVQQNMNAVIADAGKQSSALKQQLQDSQDATADLQTQLNQSNHDLQLAKQEAAFHAKANEEAKARFDTFRAELQTDEKTRADQLSTVVSDRDNLAKINAQLLAEKDVWATEKARLEDEAKKLSVLQSQLVDERTHFNQEKGALQNQIHGLLGYETQCLDAAACLDSIERELNKYSINVDRLKAYLESYRNQTRRRAGRSNAPR